MNFKNIINKPKYLIEKVILKYVNFKFNGFISLFLNRNFKNNYGALENFSIPGHNDITIFKNYRYKVKKGWAYFQSFIILDTLRSLGKLTKKENIFFNHAKGYRTILSPINEINEYALIAARRNSELFDPKFDLENQIPHFIPSLNTLQSIINLFITNHKRMFMRISSLGIYEVINSPKILEIGFISGGHSLFAFEKLGFDVYGVDNSYSGLVKNNFSVDLNKKILNSKVKLTNGDITKTLPFPSETFDIIYSTSVLEHIQYPEYAFKEMYRLLKPKGIIIHNYAPFYSHDGAHALGIGDAPWLHVRLSKNDYLKYIKKFRTYEYEVARDWINNALNYNMTQSKMQQLIIKSGFDINFWMAKSSDKIWISDLNGEIIRDCFLANNLIGIEDLITQSVSFVCTKNKY